ncbi:MAG: hypothetical protein JRE47_10140 [Deltaproteobacteria bacterium]|nr:hypothetical protein [Deltaproteobacteria bacterium]
MEIKDVIKKLTEEKKHGIKDGLLQSSKAKKMWEQFECENRPVATIEKPHIWDNEFIDKYRIYQVDEDYIAMIEKEYWGLGTPDADSRHSSAEKGYIVMVETVEWKTKKITLDHWEDGEMAFQIADISENKIKYMMNAPAPEGFLTWENQEYRDFGCQFDEQEYDKMWYSEKVGDSNDV